MLQSLVGKVHLHVDVSLPVAECAWDLQSFSLHCRQPNLENKRCHSAWAAWPEENKQAEFSNKQKSWVQKSTYIGTLSPQRLKKHYREGGTWGVERMELTTRSLLLLIHICSQHSRKKSNYYSISVHKSRDSLCPSHQGETHPVCCWNTPRAGWAIRGRTVLKFEPKKITGLILLSVGNTDNPEPRILSSPIRWVLDSQITFVGKTQTQIWVVQNEAVLSSKLLWVFLI